MERFAQVGIALAALGLVLALMGLFPGVTGAEPTNGIGIIQVFMMLTGYALLIIGALVYVKFTFYLRLHSNLTQQIGTRLALTGLLFASISGVADMVGFGSHIRTPDLFTDVFLGQWQAFGILASFAISSIGVLIYAVAGYPQVMEAIEAVPESKLDTLTNIPRVTDETVAQVTPADDEAPEDSPGKS